MTLGIDNPIIVLSKTPCPNKYCEEGKIISGKVNPIPVISCSTCHGTGSLIPKLMKRCDAPDPSWNSSNDTTVYGHRDVCQCQGTEKILVPIAEQVLAMLAAIREYSKYKVGRHNWGINISAEVIYQAVMSENVAEELASTICQAL